MKNLNPISGYKQTITGHYYISRITVLELRRKHLLTPSEMGFFFLFVNTADWDKGEHRFSYIRHSFAELSSIWRVSESAIRDNFVKLVKKGVMRKEKNTPKVVDFDKFMYSHVVSGSKEKFSDKEVSDYFGLSLLKTENKKKENGNQLQKHGNSCQLIKDIGQPFRDSFKDSNKVNNKSSDVAITNEGLRSESEYEKLYKQNPDFSIEDMRWVDNWIWKNLSVLP